MKGKRLLTSVWVAYGLAWTLPVVKDGVTLPEGVPGWQALRVALDPVWPYEGVEYGAWWAAALAVLSGGSNLLMAASLVGARHLPALGVLWPLATAAFVVNAQWCLIYFDVADLRPGYLLWWASFLGLAYVVFTARGQKRRVDPPRDAPDARRM